MYRIFVEYFYNSFQNTLSLSLNVRLKVKLYNLDSQKRGWGNEIELKIRREDTGVAKIKYPSFNEIGLRYIADVSITKKGFVNERNIIKSLFLEPFSAYPINKITPDVIGKFRDRQLTSITVTSINRKQTTFILH